MSLIWINGHRLEVRRIEGSDRRAPLVFLHEGLGSVSLWTQSDRDWPLAVCQATGRAGVVYSRLGYGQSDAAPPGRHSLEPDYMHREAWEVLPALLAQLQIQSPVLLGHSDGATIALLHASRYRVSACIAMAPHVRVEDLAIEAIAAARTAFETGPLRERLSRHHADVDGAFWQWNDIWLSAGFRSFDIRPECRHISVPLMLIQGLNDEYGTLQQLDDIAQAAPQAVQLRLSGCGHSPQRDQAQTTLEAISVFLSSAE